MSCPDIERVLDHELGESGLPEVEAHARGCLECRNRLRLVREIREACGPATIRVPQALIERGVDEVMRESDRAKPVHSAGVAAITAVLATATVLITLVVSGSLGSADPVPLLALASAAAVVAVAWELRAGRRERGEESRPVG